MNIITHLEWRAQDFYFCESVAAILSTKLELAVVGFLRIGSGNYTCVEFPIVENH
jgi:hypothetical protein